MGDPRNKLRHLEKMDRILAGLADPEKARLAAAVRHLMLPRCACGFTWYDRTIYAVPQGWREPVLFVYEDCAPVGVI